MKRYIAFAKRFISLFISLYYWKRRIDRSAIDYIEKNERQGAFARKILNRYYGSQIWLGTNRTFTSYPQSKIYHPSTITHRSRLLLLTLLRKNLSATIIYRAIPSWVKRNELLMLEWRLAEIEVLVSLGRSDEGHEKFELFSKAHPNPNPTTSAFLHDAARSLKKDVIALEYLHRVIGGADISLNQRFSALDFCRRAGFPFDAEKIISVYPDYWFEIEELDILRRSITGDTKFVLSAQADPLIASGDGFSTYLPESLVHYISSKYQSTVRNDYIPGRVLIINSSLAPGGAERQIVATIQGVKASADDLESIHLATRWVIPVRDYDFYLPQIQSVGLTVPSLMKLSLPEILDALDAEFPDKTSDVEIISRLSGNLRKTGLAYYLHILRTRPEVVHLWQDQTNILGGVAALLAGTPRILLSTRSLRPTKHTRIFRYLHSGYMALLKVPRVTLLNNSKAGAEDYGIWLKRDPAEFKVIYNGLDVSGMADTATPDAIAAVRQKLKIPENAFVVGGVMRMSSEKQPDLWLEVAIRLAKRHPEMHFVLVGDGPMKDMLEKRVADQQLTDRIHLPGTARPVAPWMMNMDTLFSSSEIEGLPNVIIEAQGLGICVVATNAGGSSEALIDGVTGYVGQTSDPDEYVALLEKVISDQKWREGAATRARQFIIERFDRKLMASHMCAVYGVTSHSTEEEKQRDGRVAHRRQYLNS